MTWLVAGGAGQAGTHVGAYARIRRELVRRPTRDRTDLVRGRRGATGAHAEERPSADTAERPADTAGRARRIQVISASIGAGHDGATQELTARLTQRGFQVDYLDFMSVFPGWLGSAVRGTYHAMLVRQPWIYGMLFRIGCKFAGAAPATRMLLRPLHSRLLRRLPADMMAVVATFPLAVQVLGPLRRSGHLTVPAMTYFTDFAVHPIWVADGMDMNCAAHEVSRRQAHELGARDVRLAGRAVSPRFRPVDATGRSETRQRLGLPASDPLALLVAGSWGVGSIEQTVADVLGSGAATPVVVCGGNTMLYRRLRRKGMAHIFGWVDDMASLLQAVDVLIENAGGLTAVEAMACGVPVVTYRPIPGHGIANAAAMARAGVSRWVRTAGELGPALAELINGGQAKAQRAAALTLFESDPATAIADTVKAGLPPQPGHPADEGRGRGQHPD